MALAVEDGTGLATAESYVSVSEANTWWSKRKDAAAWTALSDSEKEAALIAATEYVDNQTLHPFKGQRASASQALQWPRTGAHEDNGPAIQDDEIPVLVIRATLAVSLLAHTTDLQPVLARGGQVTSESVGSISRSYAAGAPGHDVIMSAEGILKPLIRCQRDPVGLYVPAESMEEDGQVFSLGMHRNHG